MKIDMSDIISFFESDFGKVIINLSTLVASLITILAFVITILSYYKIGKIKRGQIKYKDLVDVRGTVVLLSNISDLIKTIKKDQSLDSNLNEQLDNIISEISKNIGQINSVNRALFNEEEKQNIDPMNPPMEPLYAGKGFYDDDFFRDIILKAKKRIIICCKRNTRPFKQGHVDKLIKKATEGIDVQILSISPNMNDQLLEAIRESVPHPPINIDELKATQITNFHTYLDRKNKMHEKDKQRINYYETSEIIWFNFVLVDNSLYWGLVNYKKTEEAGDVYTSRPYVTFSSTDPFAKKILKIYNNIIKDIDGK